jgi:hypothetical protein
MCAKHLYVNILILQPYNAYNPNLCAFFFHFANEIFSFESSISSNFSQTLQIALSIHRASFEFFLEQSK